MTINELKKKLEEMPDDALVYTMAHDDDIALIVTDVKADSLTGKEKTVVLIY